MPPRFLSDRIVLERIACSPGETTRQRPLKSETRVGCKTIHAELHPLQVTVGTSFTIDLDALGLMRAGTCVGGVCPNVKQARLEGASLRKHGGVCHTRLRYLGLPTIAHTIVALSGFTCIAR